MSNSYKFYSETKDIIRKYVNATEGAIIYGISKSRIMVFASEAGAVYKVGNSPLFLLLYKNPFVFNVIAKLKKRTV